MTVKETCIGCKASNDTIEGDLCAPCFANLPTGKWSNATGSTPAERVAARVKYLARQIVRAKQNADTLKLEQYIGRFDETLVVLEMIGVSDNVLENLAALLDQEVAAQ